MRVTNYERTGRVFLGTGIYEIIKPVIEKQERCYKIVKEAYVVIFNTISQVFLNIQGKWSNTAPVTYKLLL